MPWFRRKRKDDPQHGGAIAIATAEEVPEPTELEQDGAASTEAPGEVPGAPKRKRRRGSRGGKGRKKTSTTAAGEASAVASEPPAKAPAWARKGERKDKGEGKDKERERRSTRQGARRRQQQRRAPLPAAKRELLISVDIGEQRVAILEDDRVAEVYLERPERRSIAGKVTACNIGLPT